MVMVPLTSNLSYLTDDLPGIGGRIKERPEDFQVEELPLYEAGGDGEHLYMFIEKQHQTTSDVVRRLAKLFGVNRSDIGYAGLKDKHAVTRQHFSAYVPVAGDDRRYLDRFEFLPFKLLWARRHSNKLRRGHLAGNRFVINIRQVDPFCADQVQRTLERLADTGVPNYVGHQRFGYLQHNHVLGRLLIKTQWQELLDEMLGQPEQDCVSGTTAGRQAYEQGQYSKAIENWPRHLRYDRQALDTLRQGKRPQDAVLAIEAEQREFLVSAAQSDIFNQVLNLRISGTGAPGIDRLVAGDLAFKHVNRSVFMVDQATADQENGPGGGVQTLEVSASGPMWGANMERAGGQTALIEMRSLTEAGLTQADLAAAQHPPVYGTRRPLRVPLREPQVSAGVDANGPFVRVTFILPRGAYATVVLREIMKQEDRQASRFATQGQP